MNYFLRIDQSDLDNEMRALERQSKDLEINIYQLQDTKAIIDEALENIKDLISQAEMEGYEDEWCIIQA